MLLPLRESVKSFKRWISQRSHGMNNDSNSTELEADEILSSVHINNIQDIWKWLSQFRWASEVFTGTVINYWKALKGKGGFPASDTVNFHTYVLINNFSHTWHHCIHIDSSKNIFSIWEPPR